MKLSFSKERTGEFYIVAAALLWSAFPVATVLLVSALSPLWSLTLSTLFAAAYFAGVITWRQQWRFLFVRAAWQHLLIVTAIIGVGFYGLFFWGLQHTSAGNASIIALMEVVFSFIILGAWKKETIDRKLVAAAGLIACGSFVVLFPGTWSVRFGDAIILLATALPPIGNYFMQQARQFVSASFIMFWRSLVGGLVLALFAIFIDGAPSVSLLQQSLPLILLVGVVLLGFSKVLWIEGIHRIPITKAISLSSFWPVFALLLSFVFLNEVPSLWQLVGVVPSVVGVWLLMHRTEKLHIV